MNNNTKELNLKEMEKTNGGINFPVFPFPPYQPFPNPQPPRPVIFDPIKMA